MSYATLNKQFNLLQPPPKSVFSTAREEAGRAWFPDFTKEQDPVGSLKGFIEILFYPHLQNSTFVQLKVLSVLTAIIGVWILLIIVRRVWEKSFWLFRLVKRSNGTLIVPNAITAFVAIESIFAILLIALLVCFVSTHDAPLIRLADLCHSLLTFVDVASDVGRSLLGTNMADRPSTSFSGSV